MTKYFFDRTDVVRALSKILKHLQIGHVVTIKVGREGVSEFYVETHDEARVEA